LTRPALRAGLVALVVVGLDQLVKAWVRSGLQRGEVKEVLPFLDLVNTRNTGVAFGLFSGSGIWVTIVVALIALGALVAFFVANRRKALVWLPTGLLIGGAIGNLIDRTFRDDGVTDFVKLPKWPAFNVADMAITVGVVLLVIVLERRERTD
jgi:signal peptidase II